MVNVVNIKYIVPVEFDFPEPRLQFRRLHCPHGNNNGDERRNRLDG